jgi:hypothetical protein
LFSDFAKTVGFDANNPDNWYSVTLAQLMKANKVRKKERERDGGRGRRGRGREER